MNSSAVCRPSDRGIHNDSASKVANLQRYTQFRITVLLQLIHNPWCPCRDEKTSANAAPAPVTYFELLDIEGFESCCNLRYSATAKEPGVTHVCWCLHHTCHTMTSLHHEKSIA